LGLAAAAALRLLGAPAAAAPDPARALEYQVKAVYLYNFAQFVTWPRGAFAGRTAPLELCIAGEDPFGPALDRVVQGERVDGHPLVVRRDRTHSDLRGCHILFVGASEDSHVEAVLAGLGDGATTLTVGESGRFLRAGGLIRFKLDQNRVRLEVNRTQLDRQGLKLSSKLLRVAELVTPAESSSR
jgi:hypothetical protein